MPYKLHSVLQFGLWQRIRRTMPGTKVSLPGMNRRLPFWACKP